MQIDKRKCQCGCGRTFHGTEKRKWFSDACKQKAYRQRIKSWNEMSKEEKRAQFES